MAEAEIKTIISANTDSFEAGLQQAIAALNKAQGKFAASNKQTQLSFEALTKAAKGLAGAFIVREAVAFGQKILELGDKMQTLSERTGASASFFSALQPEIENAGGSLDDFAASLNKMNINIAKALAGDKGAGDAFKAIGLDVKQLVGLKPEDQFYRISTAIANLSTKGQQAAGAVGIFGKGIATLLPTVEKGGDALRAFHDEQVRLGLAMSDDTAQRIDELGDSIHTLTLQTLNFSAKALIDGLDAIKIGLIGIAENGILAAKALGLLDAEVAKQAIEIGNEKIALVGKPKQGPNLPGTGKGNLSDSTATDKAADNAEKLKDALAKLQRQTSRDIYTDGLTPLDQKLKEIDFTAEDLARQYKTKLTPELQNYIDTAKENIKIKDALDQQIKLANDLGDAFGDAFGDAISGADSFGDVLGNLAKQLEKIAVQTFITKPLQNLFGQATQGLGSSLGSFLPTISLGSFATGISNVPYDMTARLHQGETVLTRQETDTMSNGKSSGSQAPSYNIDARGAGSEQIRQLQNMMIALAGPGVTERRVNMAQTRGAI